MFTPAVVGNDNNRKEIKSANYVNILLQLGLEIILPSQAEHLNLSEVQAPFKFAELDYCTEI